MARRSNTALIGVFVIGATVLVLAGLLFLGAGRWLSSSFEYVLAFREPVTGLGVGAPVEFRGVKVGEVTLIRAIYDRRSNAFVFPVYITMEAERFETIGDPGRGLSQRELTEALVGNGLRAQIETQSYVTGLKRVALDFFKNTPAQLSGIDPDYFELPTTPSRADEISNALRQIPFEQVGSDLVEVVRSLKTLLGPASDGSPQTITDAVAETRQVIQALEREIPLTLTETRKTLQSARLALEQAQAALHTMSGAAASFKKTAELIDPTLEDTRTAMRQAAGAMQQAREAIVTVQYLASEDSALYQDVGGMARETAAAAKSLRQLADELRRHPDSLLRGRRVDQ